MKLSSFFDNLIKATFVIVFSFFISYSDFSDTNALPINKNDEMIVEELRLNVPLQYRDIWIEAEREVWEPWLAKQDGFLGRKIFYNHKQGEALLLVNWKNRRLWKNIPSEEVIRIQNIFEENIKNKLKIDTNPFVLIYEGELSEQK
tara:strand:- start:370 stop:807 length:438 start_codon:yes stop_codon:yes gene_type:complete